MKTNQRWLAFACLLLLVVGTSGCISIEQEIFLQPDGSGDLLLHIGLPDLPEDAKKSPAGGNPAEAMDKFKREVVAKLPPTIKLVSAKETKRNGTQGFYAVFHFQDVREVQKLMAEILKESTEGTPGTTAKGKPPEWTLKYSKQGGVTNFSQMFFADVKTESGAKAEVTTSKPKPAARSGKRTPARGAKPPAPTTASGNAEFKMEGMENLESLILTVIKFRFVLHTPTPIKDSNADFVINNGKSALWDCSLAAFAKDKKPIEMKASF